MTPPYHYTHANGVNKTVKPTVNAGGYGETAPTITPPNGIETNQPNNLNTSNTHIF